MSDSTAAAESQNWLENTVKYNVMSCELSIPVSEQINALYAVVVETKDPINTLKDIVRKYEQELIHTYSAPSQCTISLTYIVQALCLTQEKKVDEPGLEQINYHVCGYYRTFKEHLGENPDAQEKVGEIYTEIRKNLSLKDIYDLQEIDGDEDYMVLD